MVDDCTIFTFIKIVCVVWISPIWWINLTSVKGISSESISDSQIYFLFKLAWMLSAEDKTWSNSETNLFFCSVQIFDKPIFKGRHCLRITYHVFIQRLLRTLMIVAISVCSKILLLKLNDESLTFNNCWRISKFVAQDGQINEVYKAKL